jgi:hypothetical protein
MVVCGGASVSQLRRFRPVNGDEMPPIAAQAAAGNDVRVTALREAAVETPDDYVKEIGRLWTRAQKAFLDIGKLLIQAKARLPHGTYTTHVEERLPFSARTAHMLRSAAEWAISMEQAGRITVDQLPGSYTTIYLLSTFEPPIIEQAISEGVVRPDVRRHEILFWRQERFGSTKTREELEARLARIRREREKLDVELAKLEEDLRSLSTLEASAKGQAEAE